METIFITATGTSIGKTHIAANLAAEMVEKGFQPVVSKPVASDWADPIHTDTSLLLRAAGKAVSKENMENCSPWHFKARLGPDLAADLEGRTINFNDLVKHCRQLQGEHVIIEGCGGVMSPIAKGKTNLDLIAKLDCSVVLVTGSYLGAITHTLTAIEVLKAKKRKPAYVVISESTDSIELEMMEASIKPFLDIPYLVVSRNSKPSLIEFLIANRPKTQKA